MTFPTKSQLDSEFRTYPTRIAENQRGLSYTGPHPTTLEQAWDITEVKWAAMGDRITRECGGTDTCGLCMLFHPRYTSEMCCLPCPIAQYGYPRCEGTPFDFLVTLAQYRDVATGSAQFVDAIKCEVAFLEKTRRNFTPGVLVTMGGSSRARQNHIRQLKDRIIPFRLAGRVSLNSKRLLAIIPLRRLDESRSIQGISKSREQWGHLTDKYGAHIPYYTKEDLA